jgi:hypothetical protein
MPLNGALLGRDRRPLARAQHLHGRGGRVDQPAQRDIEHHGELPECLHARVAGARLQLGERRLREPGTPGELGERDAVPLALPAQRYRLTESGPVHTALRAALSAWFGQHQRSDDCLVVGDATSRTNRVINAGIPNLRIDVRIAPAAMAEDWAMVNERTLVTARREPLMRGVEASREVLCAHLGQRAQWAGHPWPDGWPMRTRSPRSWPSSPRRVQPRRRRAEDQQQARTALG